MKHFVPSSVPAEGLGVLSLFRVIEEAVPAFFRPDRPILIARAPGRLDVMGGGADWSGSLALQVPIAEAACVAVQLRDDDLVRLWSPNSDGSRTQLLSMRLAELGLPGEPIAYDEARVLFGADPRDRWSGYLLGCLLVLARERGVELRRGAELLLHSDVPEGAGVGSSSAVAVAAMTAFAGLHGITLDGREVASLCARVDNDAVGAPGGLADLMTAARGEADEILALRREPGELSSSQAVPAEIEFVGLDSGVRRQAGRDDRELVRAGAFIGACFLADLRLWAGHRAGAGVISQLADCSVDEFSRLRDQLPEKIGGAEFLQRYGDRVDVPPRIDPQRTYAVRAPTEHAIAENARAERFLHLVQQQLSPAVRRELGDLMFRAHESCSACGIGDPTTDFLVQQARQRREAGAELYGAKVSGGGGTVVLLGERGKVWYEALRIKKALLQATGHSAHVFRWSSPGAVSFGTVELAPEGG